MSTSDHEGKHEEERKRLGRPPLGIETGVLNVKVPLEVLTRVRQHTAQRGLTIAAFVRQALEEKMEREEGTEK